MKIEIGGGKTPRGDGFTNLDRLECADIQIDLERDTLPFEDDSVDEVYSAHCLEHVYNAVGVLREVLRVCKVGAPVELRFPHWLHEMANCLDHKHVISERQVRIWCEQSHLDFPDGNKRFDLLNVHYQIDVDHYELLPLLPGWTPDQVAKFIPNCCHEVRFSLQVVER